MSTTTANNNTSGDRRTSPSPTPVLKNESSTSATASASPAPPAALTRTSSLGSKILPMELLWKWLYINFVPLSSNTSGGIPRDLLVKEFLAQPEINKGNDRAQFAFAKVLISRLLVVMHKGSNLIPCGFMDEKKTIYCLKRVKSPELEKRQAKVPPFPDEIRSALHKEVREEMLGRKSAQSLLSLASGQQGNGSPTITPASTNTTTSPATPSSSSASARPSSSPSLVRSLSLPVGQFSLFNQQQLPSSATNPAPAPLRRVQSIHPSQTGPNKRQKRDNDDELQIIEDHPPPVNQPSLPVAPSFSSFSAGRNLLAEIEQLNKIQAQTQRELDYLRRRDRLWSAELVSLKAEINLLRNQIEISKAEAQPFPFLADVSPISVMNSSPSKGFAQLQRAGSSSAIDLTGSKPTAFPPAPPPSNIVNHAAPSLSRQQSNGAHTTNKPLPVPSPPPTQTIAVPSNTNLSTVIARANSPPSSSAGTKESPTTPTTNPSTPVPSPPATSVAV